MYDGKNKKNYRKEWKRFKGSPKANYTIKKVDKLLAEIRRERLQKDKNA